MSDPVGDTLIRIKNGYAASKSEVTVRYSKLIKQICELLKKEGYIVGYKDSGNQIVVSLKYDSRTAALSGVKRVSKPSLRVYKGADSLPRVLNGLGVAIVSTPKGVMTDKEARKLHIGGEVLALVW